MNAGKPVIATRVGGIPEIVHDGRNGLLIPPGDTDSLFAAMKRIVDDEELRHRLGESARLTIAGQFYLDSFSFI